MGLVDRSLPQKVEGDGTCGYEPASKGRGRWDLWI